jgi:hypothetical protein
VQLADEADRTLASECRGVKLSCGTDSFHRGTSDSSIESVARASCFYRLVSVSSGASFERKLGELVTISISWYRYGHLELIVFVKWESAAAPRFWSDRFSRAV